MDTVDVPLDAELVKRATEIARSRNMSIEAYLERLMRVVTAPPPSPDNLGPITRKLSGILPPMTDEEVEAAIDEYRMNKYGRP